MTTRPDEPLTGLDTAEVRPEQAPPVAGLRTHEEVPLPVTHLVLGVLSVVGREVTTAVRHATGRSSPSQSPPAPESTLRLLPDAVLGLALAAQRRSLHAAGVITSGAARQVPPQVRGLVTPALTAKARRYLQAWSARGRAERTHAEAMVTAMAQTLFQEVTEAGLDQIDLDAVVDRVDPDRVVARVDLDALLARIDLAARTNEVLDEIDINQIIRDSSGGLATETIEAFREQTTRADRVVSRIAGHLIPHRGGPQGAADPLDAPSAGPNRDDPARE